MRTSIIAALFFALLQPVARGETEVSDETACAAYQTLLSKRLDQDVSSARDDKYLVGAAIIPLDLPFSAIFAIMLAMNLRTENKAYVTLDPSPKVVGYWDLKKDRSYAKAVELKNKPWKLVQERIHHYYVCDAIRGDRQAEKLMLDYASMVTKRSNDRPGQRFHASDRDFELWREEGVASNTLKGAIDALVIEARTAPNAHSGNLK